MNTVKFKCLNCGNDDYYPLSQKKYYPTTGKYCTKKCMYDHYKKDRNNHPRSKDSDTLRKNGYLWSNKNKKYRHRIVVEEYINRELKIWECIHHIDGNKLNNDIKNLQITNPKHHGRTTFFENYEDSLKSLAKGRRNRWIKWKLLNKWAMKFNLCLSCKTIKYKHQARGFCSHCYLKKYRQSHVKY